MTLARLYVGCPIWAYKGWVGSFYPESTRPSDYLREYSRRLNAVEGNTTFYAVPSEETLARWSADTQLDFRFCLKLPRTISHSSRLSEHLEEALTFHEIVTRLGSRLGPLFLQLPPRFAPDHLPDLTIFLERWPAETRLAVEVRHPGWFDPPHKANLDSLLTEHNVARVIIDTRPIRSLKGDRILQGSVYQRLLESRQHKPDLPVVFKRTAPFAFIRYIGHPAMNRNEEFFEEWSETLSGWLREGTEVYMFCHCPDERLDPWLCRFVYERVSIRSALPPLPWSDLDGQTTRQPRLF